MGTRHGKEKAVRSKGEGILPFMVGGPFLGGINMA